MATKEQKRHKNKNSIDTRKCYTDERENPNPDKRNMGALRHYELKHELDDLQGDLW